LSRTGKAPPLPAALARAALDSVADAVVIVGADGGVVHLNPAAEELFGRSRERSVELPARALPGGEQLAVLAERARRAQETQPIDFPSPRDPSVPISVEASPLLDGASCVGTVLVLRVPRSSERALDFEALAAGLAHEIKNPLTSLLTFTRHLQRKFDDDRFRERFQNVVPRELERINEIVERLLELARPSRLAFTLVRLPALVERALELYANDLEARRITVVREYARDIPPIHGDEDALYRVLVNLVANALDAMTTGGRLTLRVAWSDGGTARMARRTFNRRVRIEVEDTGPGILPSDSDRVFNPFFTTKDTGTGLGLALAHKIAEDHGGTIDFRSTPGAGTTFRVVLPLVAEVSARDDEPV
jgi:two-component system nitrogen regulation sensor histidine kinase GlnL